jgi:hypothetical protein
LVSVEEFIQHPLLLLIVGAGITGIFIPWFTKRWQDNKVKTEIRLNLTQEMSKLIASAMGRIWTAIARYKRIAIAREQHTFSDEEATELYKQLETWNTRSCILSAKLKAYFPSSDIERKWAEYSILIILVWELATRIYYTDTRSDRIAIFIKDAESIWKERITIDWSQVKNGNIEELEKLSHRVMHYGDIHIIGTIFEAPMRKI